MVAQDYLISGRIGRALYVESGRWWVQDFQLAPRLARQSEIVARLDPSFEFVRAVPQRNSSLSSQLGAAIDFHNLLFLALRLLDPDCSIRTKLVCARELEAHLDHPEVSTRLLNRLLSTPLEAGARANQKSTLASIKTFPASAALLRALFRAQDVVEEVAAAWLKSSSHYDLEAVAQLRALLTLDETLAEVARACQSVDIRSYNAMMVGLISKVRPEDPLAQSRHILADMRPALETVFFQGKARPASSSLAKVSDDLLELRQDDSKYPLARGRERNLLSSFDSKSRVDKQIDAIRKEVLAGNMPRAEEFILDLKKFQSDHSELEHLAKSLCSLSSFAVAANQLDLADVLSTDALQLEVSDVVVYSNRAEVLKNMGLFSASLAQYAQAKVLFPESNYPVNGYADVLKHLGRYDEALAAYESAKRQCPESSVPFNGYVATLRAQGRKQEALVEAQKLLINFGDDPVTMSTYASALAANGDFKTAARLYQKLITSGHLEHRVVFGFMRSMNVLGRHKAALSVVKRLHDQSSGEHWALSVALAVQLRTSGKRREAISLCRGLLAEAPGYSPLKLQLATALVEEGELEEASALLPHLNLRSEADWAGYRIYLLAMIRKGDYKEARILLQDALNQCVWQNWRTHFSTLLGFTQLKLNDPRSSVSTLLSDIDHVDEHIRYSRLAIIGAAERSTGKLDKGTGTLRLLDKVLDPAIVSFKDAALRIGKKTWTISAQTELGLLSIAA